MGPLDVVAAVGDPCRRRLAALPAAAVAQRGRRGDRRAARRRDEPADEATRRAAAPHHRRACGTDMDGLRFNTAIARLIELNNHVVTGWRRCRARWPSRMVLMVAPLAPHLAEELWSRLGHARVAGVRDVPVGRPGAAGRRGRDLRRAGAGQGARPAARCRRRSARTSCASWRWRRRRCSARWTGGSVRTVIVRAPKLVNVVPV